MTDLRCTSCGRPIREGEVFRAAKASGALVPVHVHPRTCIDRSVEVAVHAERDPAQALREFGEAAREYLRKRQGGAE